MSIKVTFSGGADDPNDPFEGTNATGGGGFGDSNPESGSAPPGMTPSRPKKPPGTRGADGWQEYDEDAWGGRQEPQFRDDPNRGSTEAYRASRANALSWQPGRPQPGAYGDYGPGNSSQALRSARDHWGGRR